MAVSGSPRILVVDDQRPLLMSYELIFKRQGYTVVTADKTSTAVELLATEKFDLLLCDLSIEHDRSGLEIIDAARRLAPDTSAVLMTGYTDETLPQEVIDRGVNVVFKPVDIPRLLSTVDFLVRGCRKDWTRRRA